MKKGLLTLIAASSLCLGASAQTQYIMQVTKTNGQTELINADEVLSVSFVQGELSPKVVMMNEIRNSLYGIASRKLNFAALNMGNALLAELAKIAAADDGVIAAMQQDAIGKVKGQVKPVEEGSELAKAGYQKYAVLDFNLFDGVYSFSEDGEMTKGDATGQIVINFPVDLEDYSGNVTATLKGSEKRSEMLVPYLKDNTVALIVRLPETINVTMSNKDGVSLYDGKLNIAFEKKSEGSSYFNPLADKWTISSELNAHLKDLNDENTLTTSLSYDGSTGTVASAYGFSLNGQSVIERKAQVTLPILSQISMMIPMISNMMSLNNGSPVDMIASILSTGSAKEMVAGISAMLLNGASLDNYEVTLLGDLTISASISNIYMAIQTNKALKEARRNGADEATISQSVEQLNQFIKLGLKAKKLNAELPAKLVTTKVGVDYTPLPAVSFDGKEFTPITELIDVKSTGYLINIADHCVQPLSTAVTSLGVITGNLIKLFTLQSQEEQPVATE